MAEEKTHEHSEHHKKDEKIKFEISKVRIWQGLTVIFALIAIYLWFNPYFGSGDAGGAQVQAPTGAAPSQAPQLPTKQNIDLDDDPVLGDKNAPITIVSFEDFQCPFCGRAFQQTFPLLKKDYIDTGKAKYVYRDFPLSFHPEAQPAAEAAECADEQGKFWEFHEGVFSNQATMGRELYLNLAGELGLNAAQFTQCIDSGKYRQEVQNDFAYGSQVGVSGTPTFFINGIQLVGAQPYQAFQQVIEAELANQ